MNQSSIEHNETDVCVIGSGFGGVMGAYPFINAGLDVTMLERGDWVERGPQNWAPDATGDNTDYYSKTSAYHVLKGGNEEYMGAYHCVGGPSVFYGGVSLRFREQDFDPPKAIVQHTGATWPFGYAELEPFYHAAETLLDIAGDAGFDPTEPMRQAAYPQASAATSEISAAIAHAGQGLGLQPFKLPLAINYRQNHRTCKVCATCDTYACAVSAKNDLSSTLIPIMQQHGLKLRPNTVVRRFIREGDRIVAVDCVDRDDGREFQVRARHFILGAGALASPLLLLNSQLDEVNPAGAYIGRYLMRHVNAIVFGLFPRLPGRLDTFHKQIGFHDFYFGHPDGLGPAEKLGALQQIHSPPVALVKLHLPSIVGTVVSPLAKRMTGLLAIGEDQPNPANYVKLNPDVRDPYGLPQLQIEHTYSERDLAVVKVLAKEAKKILKATGARVFYTHHIRTFSHAVGTVRMGPDPQNSPLDEFGRFRGISNLTVTDGSAFPTAAAVNPSLTISALALRSSSAILEQDFPSSGQFY